MIYFRIPSHEEKDVSSSITAVIRDLFPSNTILWCLHLTEQTAKVLRLGLVCWNGSWNSLVYTPLTDDIGDVKMEK